MLNVAPITPSQTDTPDSNRRKCSRNDERTSTIDKTRPEDQSNMSFYVSLEIWPTLLTLTEALATGRRRPALHSSLLTCRRLMHIMLRHRAGLLVQASRHARISGRRGHGSHSLVTYLITRHSASTMRRWKMRRHLVVRRFLMLRVW